MARKKLSQRPRSDGVGGPPDHNKAGNQAIAGGADAASPEGQCEPAT
jgi:hypothetical protein